MEGEMVALWPQRQRSEGYSHSPGIHMNTRGKMQGMELPYSLQGAHCPPPWSVPRGTDFGLRASRIVREKISVILSHEVCANLLETSWETRAVYIFKDETMGTSSVAQWLGLQAPNAGGPGLIPGQGSKMPRVATKTWHC